MVNQGFEIVSDFEIESDGSVKSVNLGDLLQKSGIEIENVGFDDPTEREIKCDFRLKKPNQKHTSFLFTYHDQTFHIFDSSSFGLFQL